MAAKKVTNRQILDALVMLGVSPKDIARLTATGAQSTTFKNRITGELARMGRGTGTATDLVNRAFGIARWEPDPKKPQMDNLESLLRLSVPGYNRETNAEIVRIATANAAKSPGLRKAGTQYGDTHYWDAVAQVLGVTPGVQNAFRATGINYAPITQAQPVAPGAKPGAPAPAGGGGLGGIMRRTKPAPAKRGKNPPGPTGLGQMMRRMSITPPGEDGEDFGTLGDGGAGGGGGDDGGAGGGGGMADVPEAPPPLAANASDAEVEAYIRNNFGFAAWALDEPEIRQVLVDFTRDMRGYEFSPDQLEAKLLNTQWWKDKNVNARARIREKNEDPATYNQGILDEGDKLQALIDQSGGGFNISPTRLQEMARTSYKMGWTPAEMRSALAAEFDYDPTGGAQTASAIVGTLKTLAGQYLVPLSEATIDEWGRAMIAGTANEDTINGYLREQAKILLPAFATQIDAGLTPSALVEPYRQTIARELGSNPSEIDFLDPKYNRFISGRDPKTGQAVPMDPYEIQKTIRTDTAYGWNETAGARGQATEFITALAERFGRAG